MNSARTLGITLQTARRARGLRQIDVGRKLGLKSGQPISDLERGRTAAFPPHLLVKIIRLYKLDENMVCKLYIEREKERLEARLRKKLALALGAKHF